MAGFGLPKLRWLIVGAIAAGIWVVREDMKIPRPPERVGAQSRQASEKPQPQKALSAKPAAPRQTAAQARPEKPVPPRPVTARKQQPSAVPVSTALALPKTVQRPPARPQKIVTGSVSRPDKPTFVQTTTKVNLRAQARTDAPIIATLQPGTVMQELVRSGDWRLVMGNGNKGWLRDDYVEASGFLKRRPRLPVAETGRHRIASAEKRK